MSLQVGASTSAEVLRAAKRVLTARPAALISDIDGTLSPIVPRPEDARVSACVRDWLERLAERLDLVAIVTARDAAAARRMIDARGVTYVTHYGLKAGDGASASAGFVAAMERARALAAAIEGVSVEEKGLSLAFHYRASADPAAARQRLLAALAPPAADAGARLQEGKRVVELLPPGLPGKASAVAELIATSAARGVVYLGDDLSDVAVFQLLGQRRDAADLPALAVAVVDPETPPEILAAADLALAGVTAVERFLSDLADSLADRRESER